MKTLCPANKYLVNTVKTCRDCNCDMCSDWQTCHIHQTGIDKCNPCTMLVERKRNYSK